MAGFTEAAWVAIPLGPLEVMPFKAGSVGVFDNLSVLSLLYGFNPLLFMKEVRLPAIRAKREAFTMTDGDLPIGSRT